MKLYCTSDVHSFYDELMIALDNAGFDINNEEHIFVSCGDLLDRGPFAEKCLKFVNSLPDSRKILIRGNHELLAMNMIRNGYYGQHDWWNGTADTAQQLCGYTDPYCVTEDEVIEGFSKNQEWVKYYQSTVYYKEIGDYIFTHAWIPYDIAENGKLVYDKNWRNASFHECIWDNGMLLWRDGIREPSKTIVCGHFHSMWGHKNLHNEFSSNYPTIDNCRPFEDEGIIALDSMVPASRFLNVKVIEVDNELFEKWF